MYNNRLTIFRRFKDHMVVLACLPVENVPDWCNNWPIQSMYATFIVIVLLLFFICTATFLCFEDKTFDEFAESVFYTAQASLYVCLYSIIYNCKDGYLRFIDELEDIIERRMKNARVKNVYIETNDSYEKSTTKFCNVANKALLPVIVCPAFFLSFVTYFLMGRSSEAFQLIFVAWFPFEWKNPIGYIFATILESMFFTALLESAVFSLMLYVGMCQYSIAFVTDMVINLHHFDETFNNLSDTFTMGDQTHLELHHTIQDVIKFHCQSKKFVTDFSNYYGALIFVFFSFGAIFTATGLLYMSYLVSIGDIPGIFHQIFLTGAAVTWYFVYCNLGNEVTTQYEVISDVLYDCSYALLLLRMGKHLPIVLNNAQEPVKMRGLMNVECTRECFKKLTNVGYTYFTMLNQFQS